MNLYEWAKGDEGDSVYSWLSTRNGLRLYDLMESMIVVATNTQRPWLSEALLKAFNYHALVGLHHEAGQYRPCEVTVGEYNPPAHYRVKPLMDNLINEVNWRSVRAATAEELIILAAHVLWRINWIHPFINGNGRTARAACYYVVCVGAGGPLPGTPILPEMLSVEPGRTRYYSALEEADKGELAPLVSLIRDFLNRQLASINP